MRIFGLTLFAFLATNAFAHPFDHLAEELAHNPELVDVSQWEGVQLDIHYATTNNFTHQNVYGPFHSCFVHKRTAEGFQRVLTALKQQKPGWKIRAFDCLRPVRAQVKLFAVVRGTPEEKYVANPAFGSLHSYGFAMDVSLNDDHGKQVDMGTTFDFFGDLAEPQNEDDMLSQDLLSRQQYQNRRLLRSLMKAGGFQVISTEWWHFDALPGATVRANYKAIP